MSQDDYLKIVIGLSAAFAGWILAQITSGVRGWLYRRKVERLLLAELGDLDQQLDRLLTFYSRQLQIVGAGGVSSETAVGLSNPVYNGYYKDALLSLHQTQRMSYQLIHASVEHVNWGISHVRELSLQIYARVAAEGMTESLSKSCKAWGDAIQGQFLACAALQWQVRFHLRNKARPDVSINSPELPVFRKYLQSAKDRAGEHMEQGKTVPHHKFEQFIHPDDPVEDDGSSGSG